METFYTLVKIAPNPISGDSISIGLLVKDSEKFWLHFSDDKKALAKRLLDKKGDSIDFIIKQLEQKVKLANQEITSKQVNFFTIHDFIDSEKALNISTYFNGIVRFSPPSFLNDVLDQVKFEKLFQLLVDKTFSREKPIKIESPFITKINQKLIKRVVDKVHTNLHLTAKELPGLYYNLDIDCIGKNGSLIGAKSISFDRAYETIDKDLSHYLALIPLLKAKFTANAEDKFYVIADEPNEIGSREHKIWETLLNNTSINVLDSEHSDKVAEEIENRHAKKFLTLFDE